MTAAVVGWCTRWNWDGSLSPRFVAGVVCCAGLTVLALAAAGVLVLLDVVAWVRRKSADESRTGARYLVQAIPEQNHVARPVVDEKSGRGNISAAWRAPKRCRRHAWGPWLAPLPATTYVPRAARRRRRAASRWCGACDARQDRAMPTE